MPAHLIAEEGPLRGLVLNLEEGTEWVIGRDPEVSDFTIEDSTVSRKHARLSRTPEGIYIKNLSRVNPTLINDEERPKAHLLKEGDRVHIGSNTFLFSEEAIPKLNRLPEDPLEEDSEYEGMVSSFDKPPMPLEPPPKPAAPEMPSYDTIFEDTGSGEEPAFHLPSEAPLVLKVIAGPNAGAEIDIEKGRSYTIGKDPDSCDIVFQDLSVSRNHARLNVMDDGMMRIEDLDSKNGVAVNGSIIVHPTTITPQDMIALGTTVFMIIDREAPQETIYSPISQAFESPEVVVEEPVEEAPPEPILPPRDWKKEPLPMKYLVMGGSAVAAFLIVFVTFFSLFKADGIESPQEAGGEIKTALAKFPGVQYSYNPGSGKLFLVGHVLTGVEDQELRFRLSQIDFISTVENNVVIDESVSRMMNDVLSSNAEWRGISVSAPQPGRFVVSGYVETAQQESALAEYLTVNFPYLDLLQNKVVAEQQLDLQLQALIAVHRLGGVEAQVSNGNVMLSGRYSSERKPAFDALLKDLSSLHGVASVKNLAIPVDPKLAGIDISSQYQVSGSSLHDGRGFSVVMNGKIYTLGEIVDGMKIMEIAPNRIFLEKDGLKYRIDYTL